MHNYNNISIPKIIIAVLIIATCFIAFRCHETIASNEIQTNSEKNQATKNYQQADRLSKAKAEHHFEKSSPNISTIENRSRRRVRNGVYLACTKLHTNHDVKRHQKAIHYDLGDSFGSSLINNTKPIQLVASNIQQSQKLEQLKIGFGKYDVAGQTIPMNVLIEYRSSPYNDDYSYQRQNKSRKYYYDSYRINVSATKARYNRFMVIQHVHSENNRY